MTIWTEENTELLRTMWNAGTPASQIAIEIGGVTRNAVIGKAHRMKLGLKGKPAGASTKKEGTAISKAAKAIVKMQVRTAAPVPAPAPVIRFQMPEASHFGTDAVYKLAENTCKWPVGDPMHADFRFCGSARGTEGRAPYCTHHARMAYTDSSRRSDRELERLRA